MKDMKNIFILAVFFITMSALVFYFSPIHKTQNIDTINEKLDQKEVLFTSFLDSNQLAVTHFNAMGSSFTIKLDTNLNQANKLFTKSIEILSNLEDQLSSWKMNSDVSVINHFAGVKPVKVSSSTFNLLQLSNTLYKDTNGTFDITIGPIWDLWPFRNHNKTLPSAKQIKEALPLVNGSQIILDTLNQSAYLSKVGMKINLGAIGKGYSSKVLSDFYRLNGVINGAVSAGGDLFVFGLEKGKKWKVNIENPNQKNQSIQSVYLSGMSIASSGDSERFIVRNKKKYGHIIDPRNGYPVTKTKLVSIIHPNPSKADAYATAAYIMGPSEAIEWINSITNTEGFIIDAQGNHYHSKGWVKYTKSEIQTLTPTKIVKKIVKNKHQHLSNFVSRSQSEIKTSELSNMAFIPKGKFLSGKNNTLVFEDSFYIDKTEVSNRDYNQFLQNDASKNHIYCHPQEPENKNHQSRYSKEFRSPLFLKTSAKKIAPFQKETFSKLSYPVVGVDWWDAYAYANFKRKSLPSAMQFEKSSRGTDGRNWPFGNKWKYKNVNSGGEKWGENDGHIYSAPVRSFETGKSIYGCYHLSGNVSEWTRDGYVAGGSSKSNPSEVACWSKTVRNPDFRAFDIGFRTVINLKRSL
ncbi:MAG: FAD:protein FMN transferase [Candidatus Cloacimonetes bacterium]|nr:FAD:protein FMN transferase [Candidatus Cloacimonadota bacterium]